MCAATGAKVQSTCNKMTVEVLGSCGYFEEIQVGNERYNIFKECPQVGVVFIVFLCWTRLLNLFQIERFVLHMIYLFYVYLFVS